MSVIYGDKAKQRRYDAFQIVATSGHEPLKEAIACALQMRVEREIMVKHGDSVTDPETKAQIALRVSKALPDEFKAWLGIAEFIYAKPKQQIEHSGSLSLEQLLGHWDQKPEAPITIGEAG